MVVESVRFGTLDIDEQNIIRFPEGLPGFQAEKAFAFIPYGPQSPFAFLQSVNQPELTFLVVEPTKKSLGVYRQYATYAEGYDVKLAVVANKIETEDDLAFVRESVGNDLVAWVGRSGYVRAMEKGAIPPFSSLETSTTAALAAMKQTVDGCQQDWEKFYRQAVEFHRRNALAWMNASQGEDVTAQIDSDFSFNAVFTSSQP